MMDRHPHSYIRPILAKFRMDKSRPVHMPIAMNLHKRKPNEEACEPTTYQLMIGSLMYTMTATQPNVAYGSDVLTLYYYDHCTEHVLAFTCVFGTSTARRTGIFVSEEHLRINHSDEKEKEHLDLSSIRTVLDTWITINEQADWSSRSNEWSPRDRGNQHWLPSPWPMLNTMPLE